MGMLLGVKVLDRLVFRVLVNGVVIGVSMFVLGFSFISMFLVSL